MLAQPLWTWTRYAGVGVLLLFLDDHLPKKIKRALLPQKIMVFIWTIYYI
jgi:hypothetical protein